MAAIDALLRALTRNRMDALELRVDSLPRLHSGDQQHEVTRTPLDAETIVQLMTEIAPADAAPAAGSGFAFDYALDGSHFSFAAAPATAPEWSVFARPRADAAEAPARDGPAESAVESPPPAAKPAIPNGSAGPSETSAGSAPDAPSAASTTPPAAAETTRAIGSVTELLELVVRQGASDLHLTVGQRPRLRLHGDLEPLDNYEAPGPEQLQQLLFEITPPRHREEFEQTNDADFACELPGKARFRVNLFRNRHGVAAVFRQIPEKIPTFEELGLPAHLRSLAHLSKGLVLVTGPTGSGKSTTLAAILDLINSTRRDHVITIEDPIEFVHPSKRCLVNQREVGVHTSSFKRALRAALREDPDIVLVGEMRDLETISIAIETAETGHLVFGTLHTTTAPSTVERVVDQFPGDRQEQIRIMLSESLRAVIAQTLLKRIGGGRVAAFEILICTPAVSNLIREGKTFQIPSAMQTGRRQGMCQLTDSLMELVERKLVEPGEAYLKAVDKEPLLTKFRAAGIEFDPATLGSSES